MKGKSLRSKIFWMNVILVLVAVILFASYCLYQIHRHAELAEETNRIQNEIIMDTVSGTMHQMTEESFQAYVTAEAKVIDGEFWTMKHDLEMLAKEVERVLADPDDYSDALPAPPPSAENAGKLTTQLLFAQGADQNNTHLWDQITRISELSGMMEEIVRGGETLTDCVISLVGGATLVADSYSETKVDASGTPLFFNADTRPWYIGAVAHGRGVWFSPASKDNFYERYEVMAGIPVYINNRLAAVCCGSIQMEALAGIVSSARLGERSDVSLINENGVLIYSSRTEGELGMTYDQLKRLRAAGNTELVSLVNTALEGNSGFTLLNLDGTPTYIAYAPLETVGWTQMMMISEEEMKRPAYEVTEVADIVMDESIVYVQSLAGRLAFSTGAIVAALIAVSVIMSFAFAKKLVRPINHMTQMVSRMEGDDLNFRVDEVMETGDEIGILAHAFAGMSEKTRGYVSEIVRITAEKQRLDTELSVAADIQANMLPSHFPVFPDRTEFDLYAVMDPAKEVGGDFFDFFLLDEHHLALVMADVSGKGVPAALFMVISKTLIKNAALSGKDIRPGEILRDVNNQLCEGNEDQMFVTAWLGILDVRDGSLVSASAGHEYPVFYRRETGFTLEKNEIHGLAMGAMEGVRYRETKWQMQPGDMLFLYTDGLPETTNTENELFGNERMLRALTDSLPASLEAGRDGRPDLRTLLWNVRKEADIFAGEAPQFDDLTMLGVMYYGK
ncbi:MAG: SpoIIE family protein phosphatase [Clostridia bacterium]|nr:SpoIIE family protein phosphatase [Clostridia bacterium]